MIRRATIADVPRIIEMGQAFLKSSVYQIVDNPEAMAKTATSLITSPDGFFSVAEVDGEVVGMIGMLAFATPMSGERIAGEMVWWVEPSARGSLGVRLLRAAEDWARTKDVRWIQMVAPAGSGIGTLYEHCGYQQTEVSYQRRVE